MRKILFVLAFLVCAPALRAQTPADSAGVLLGVATRLQSEGRVQLSNSLLDLIIERFNGTPAAQEALRLRNAVRASTVDQSGRTELMVFGTAYGVFLGGAIPAALSANGPEAYGVGLILGGPAGFLASRTIARTRPLSVGQARAITFGGTWGTLQGLGWAYALDIGAQKFCNEFGCFDDNDPSAEAVFTSMIVGGAAGIGVGTALSQKQISDGTASTVSFGGLWGSWYGGGLAAALGADDALTATLIGGNAGIVAAAIGSKHWQLSRERARLISISGVAGLVAGLGGILIAQPDNEDRAILIPLATSTVGLALGTHWTRNLDKRGGASENESRFSWDGPSVGARVVEKVKDGRLQRVPAIGVTLFQARF